MKVVVTGAHGFIGKNLCVRLSELPRFQVIAIGRTHSEDDLSSALADAQAVVHLAGENRPADPDAFSRINLGYTQTVCSLLRGLGRPVPIWFSSSTQASQDNLYGQSKLQAEHAVTSYGNETASMVKVVRLPGVFGKWSRPNYNSVVATFCHNIARDLPVTISNEKSEIELIHVDSVVDHILQWLESPELGDQIGNPQPSCRITVGELAAQIRSFKKCRTDLLSERVGEGFVRALYSTYVSFLPIEQFSYTVPQHRDPRGVFVEMLKTPDSGQFSFFTAHPGVTRGGHYHHCKTEKFLVIQGRARFRFRNILNDTLHELTVDGATATVVETIPGWSHDITNVGDQDMIVMLWANEVFDRQKPDTIPCKVF